MTHYLAEYYHSAKQRQQIAFIINTQVIQKLLLIIVLCYSRSTASWLWPFKSPKLSDGFSGNGAFLYSWKYRHNKFELCVTLSDNGGFQYTRHDSFYTHCLWFCEALTQYVVNPCCLCLQLFYPWTMQTCINLKHKKKSSAMLGRVKRKSATACKAEFAFEYRTREERTDTGQIRAYKC